MRQGYRQGGGGGAPGPLKDAHEEGKAPSDGDVEGRGKSASNPRPNEGPCGALPGDLGRIAEVAGLDAAVSIARAFRGTYLYVPGLDEYQKQMRDEAIKRDYDAGLSVKKISLRRGLSERQIRRILKAGPKHGHPLAEVLCGKERTSK